MVCGGKSCSSPKGRLHDHCYVRNLLPSYLGIPQTMGKVKLTYQGFEVYYREDVSFDIAYLDLIVIECLDLSLFDPLFPLPLQQTY